ncbi:MAG: fatty acid desaturase [Phycisphaerales bacterium]|nr:fatty acid desaturase [Phycisphaerales bacterium]
MALLHAACVAAPFVFTWSGLAVAVALWVLTGGLGICLCYHRLLTHRSFKTHKWVEYALTVLGTMTFQGGPLRWVSVHRIHHKHSDHDEDPHSPKHGFNWSHVLWTMAASPKGEDRAPAAKDLARDPVMVLIDRWHFVPQVALGAVLFGLGHWLAGAGLSWLVWGVAVRTVFVFHATWFVNSASHTWGYRNYATDDDSKNNWWVALLSFGEGWHNNHHAEQRAAAHGRRWFEVDLTYLTIRAMALVGLAWDIVPAEKPAR